MSKQHVLCGREDDPRLKDLVKRAITTEDGRLMREDEGGHDATCQHHHHVNHAVKCP